MTISIDIPHQLAQALAPYDGDISRAALEAMALEGYRQHSKAVYFFIKP